MNIAFGKADLFFFSLFNTQCDQSFQIKTHSIYIVVHAIVWNVSKFLLPFHAATFLDLSFRLPSSADVKEILKQKSNQ